MFKLGLFPFGPIVPTTVDIGSQTWKIKNLSVTKYRSGANINHATNSTEWKNFATAGLGCYASVDYDPANDAEYGLLYNGYAIKNSRNLAPVGYHIPTYSEITELTDFLGGTSSSGAAMKEVGTAHWTADPGNTNSSGYTDLGAGYIDTNGFLASFNTLSYNGTYDLDTNVYYYSNNSNNSVTAINADALAVGYSVRVVKNSSLAVGDAYGTTGIIAALDGNPNANNFLITIINNNITVIGAAEFFGCYAAFQNATSLTDGVSNTDILGAAGCGSVFPVFYTNSMLDRFNDWYVAAADEATALLTNLGGITLSASGPYWTSTEVNADDALTVSLSGSTWITNQVVKGTTAGPLVIRKQYI